MAGVDSLGLGSDFNGVGQYPAGLQDVSGYPNIFAALIRDKVVETIVRSGSIARICPSVHQFIRSVVGNCTKCIMKFVIR